MIDAHVFFKETKNCKLNQKDQTAADFLLMSALDRP